MKDGGLARGPSSLACQFGGVYAMRSFPSKASSFDGCSAWGSRVAVFTAGNHPSCPVPPELDPQNQNHTRSGFSTLIPQPLVGCLVRRRLRWQRTSPGRTSSTEKLTFGIAP